MGFDKNKEMRAMALEKKFLPQWIKQEWTVGQYTPSKDFMGIENHSCVCLPDLSLVAITGPADCVESQCAANLFSAAPDLLRCLEGFMEKYKSVPASGPFDGSVELWASAKEAVKRAKGLL